MNPDHILTPYFDKVHFSALSGPVISVLAIVLKVFGLNPIEDDEY
jgi:hypothetical protein